MNITSILMPVKNEERYLAECLASITAVPGETLDVVLVDDHSTDSTLEIARRIAAGRDDLQIRVFENIGHGKAAALNLAYRHAQGTAFVLLAGDDLLVSDLLPARRAAVTGEAPAIAHCRYRSFSQNPRHDGIVFPRRGREHHLAGGATSFNRAFAELYFPIPEELPNEDTWLRAVAILFDIPVTFIDRIGLHYRSHDRNSTGPSLDFAQTDLGLGRRHAAFGLALARFPQAGSVAGRSRLRSLVTAERHRAAGAWWRILRVQGLPQGDRSVFLVNSTSWLFALKRRVLPLLRR